MRVISSTNWKATAISILHNVPATLTLCSIGWVVRLNQATKTAEITWFHLEPISKPALAVRYEHDKKDENDKNAVRGRSELGTVG